MAVSASILFLVSWLVYIGYRTVQDGRSTDRLIGTSLVVAPVLAVVLYVLLSEPSGTVFSREYRHAVARSRGRRL
jgi:hypothetical protein